MRVISLKLLREFWEAHPDSEISLRQWFKTALNARWNSIQDIRRIYKSAGGVENKSGETLTVFNMGGNKCRLIVRISYEKAIINVRFVLTHAEYDKEKWKEL